MHLGMQTSLILNVVAGTLLGSWSGREDVGPKRAPQTAATH
jgi:hypothetical protein